MQLEGSCHCGAVSFSLESAHPYPYQRCYCSICRKTQGVAGMRSTLGGCQEPQGAGAQVDFDLSRADERAGG